MHALPWERLFHRSGDSEVPLAASARTPFSRFLITGAADQGPVRDERLRLLVAIANPTNLPAGMAAIDAAGEVTALADLLAELGGRVEGTLLPGRSGLPGPLKERLAREGWRVIDGAASWSNIQRRLPGQHALHILAHGQFRRDEGRAYLCLEAESGELERVADDEIAVGLSGVHPLPQLVFLATCDSAKRPESAANAFVGLAPKLVEAGVPAVVAMQDLVPVDLATR